jgi:hypothetical protein
MSLSAWMPMCSANTPRRDARCSTSGNKAGIDFHAWHRWKQSSGLYFLSLEKENMKLRIQGLPKWDRTDPVNAGIQSVELVAGLAGVMIRRIHYVESVEGTEYHFITNELNLPPGLVAFLYKLRWDVEKVFDVLKNKLNERQAWASTDTAKSVQAQLICLVHNIIQFLEEKLRREGIENRAEILRRQKDLALMQAAAVGAN